MRIEWNGASAQLVAANLDRLQEQLEASLQQARTARIALDNANPGSDNRRLNAIAAQYDRTVIRLKQASADVERLRMGTRVMIDAFEEAEREAIGIMESLESGIASDGAMDRAGGAGGSADHEIRLPEMPIPIPRTIAGPHMDRGPMGPVPAWLAMLLRTHHIR